MCCSGGINIIFPKPSARHGETAHAASAPASRYRVTPSIVLCAALKGRAYLPK